MRISDAVQAMLVEAGKWDNDTSYELIDEWILEVVKNKLLITCDVSINHTNYIIRVRCSDDYRKDKIESEKDISYKKKESKSVQIGRCNVDGQPMFYGAIQEPNVDNSYVNAIETCILEVSKSLREGTQVPEDAAIGRWVVGENSPLMACCIVDKEFINGESRLAEIISAAIATATNEQRAVARFIANKFAQSANLLSPGYAMNPHRFTSRFAHVMLEGKFPDDNIKLTNTNVLGESGKQSYHAILYPSVKQTDRCVYNRPLSCINLQ